MDPSKTKQLELYLHIPFCKKKCRYCDFLSFPADDATQEAYVDALIKEIRVRAKEYRDYSVPTVFIGGGTPSVLAPEATAALMEAAAASFFVERDAEITMECNPGTLDERKARIYRSCGINRISLGLQSVHETELGMLGRIHTFEEFLASYDILRKCGFDNINVDLMSGLPGQSLSDWQKSVRKVVSLKPEHISAYGLIVEPGTPFYEKYGADELLREQGESPHFLPTEEAEREMYDWARDYLSSQGYVPYEISNYARKGKVCRHNIGYWQRTPYLGLGLGSASLVEEQRFSNISDLKSYLKACEKKLDMDPRAVIEEESWQQLGRTEQMEEYMFLGLRMTKGISRQNFLQKFGIALEGVYGEEIRRLCGEGLLRQEEGNLALTREGISVSNYVMAQFLRM